MNLSLNELVHLQYITLFASAFPLGSAVTLLFLYVEIRSDLFKLLHVYRRPIPRRYAYKLYMKVSLHLFCIFKLFDVKPRLLMRI